MDRSDADPKRALNLLLPRNIASHVDRADEAVRVVLQPNLGGADPIVEHELAQQRVALQRPSADTGVLDVTHDASLTIDLQPQDGCCGSKGSPCGVARDRK
jgi:hypothetical protein